VRPPGRHLCVRVRALRDAVRPAGVQGRDRRRHDVGHPEGGPAAAQRPAPVGLVGAWANRGPCLEKRPEDRFSSAHDLALALGAVSTGLGQARPDTGAVGTGARRLGCRGRDRRRPAARVRSRSVVGLRQHPSLVLAAGGLAVLVAIAASWPVVVRQRQLAWVRNQALPELLRLADARDYWAAFRLAREIEAVLPGEPMVQKLRPLFAGQTRRQFRPTGATLLARPRTGATPTGSNSVRSPRSQSPCR